MAGINLALPFLMINMGGEMIYILNQRLIAQKIPADKSEKVRSDVVKHLFSEEFIKELMIPQPLYSMTSTRQVFDKIAQSSIMKLQSSSMNKLFDLMMMGVKMQIMTLSYPEQLLKLTLNHLQELQRLIINKESVNLLRLTTDKLASTYGSLSSAVYNRIRQTLLRFFQNRNVKVTMFLQSGIQMQDGTIKITVTEGVPLSDIPGTVLTSKGQSYKVLPITAKFKKSTLSTRNPLQAECSTGFNLYDSEKQAANIAAEEVKGGRDTAIVVEKNREAIAKWELNSLANMICSENDRNEASTMEVALFNDVDLEFKDVGVVEVTGVIQNQHIEGIAKSLDEAVISQRTEEDDLLDLI